MDRALVGTGVVLAAAILAAGALAVNPTEGVPLKAVDGSSVAGKATVGQRARGTHAVIALRGLPAHALVRALLHAGAPARPSASFATIGGGIRADASGHARWAADVAYRGDPVTWKTVSDGRHLISILVGGRVVARGVIPGMS